MAQETTDLTITRLLKAPRAAIWRAWSEPDLLVQWWCPKPWTTELRAFELRAGGAFHTTMRAPAGEDGVSDNPGVFLEVRPAERVVFTTSLTAGWRPNNAWLAITGVFTMADEAGGTRYTASALHADAATRDKHAEMGFHEGWGACIAQLDALALSLGR